MLGDHDDEGCEGCAADTRDGEQLNEAADIVAGTHGLNFDFDLSVDVVEVTGCLNGVIPQAEQRPVCITHPTFLDKPSGRLGAEKYPHGQRNCGNEGGTKLQSPGNGSSVFHRKVGAESEEDAKCRPPVFS